MKKFIALTGIIGTIMMILLSLLDHLIRFGDKFYFISLIIAIILMVPIIVREALIVIKLKEESGNNKKSDN